MVDVVANLWQVYFPTDVGKRLKSARRLSKVIV
jgi:hypothetical protein